MYGFIRITSQSRLMQMTLEAISKKECQGESMVNNDGVWETEWIMTENTNRSTNDEMMMNHIEKDWLKFLLNLEYQQNTDFVYFCTII